MYIPLTVYETANKRKRKIAAHQLGKNRQPPFWGCRLFAQSLYIWIPRQANFCGDAAGQTFQKEPEIWERPQAIGFRRLYNGVDSSACVSAVWRVGKQPVLPPNGKGAHSPFRPVVG